MPIKVYLASLPGLPEDLFLVCITMEAADHIPRSVMDLRSGDREPYELCPSPGSLEGPSLGVY